MTPEKILIIDYSPTIQCLLKAELGEKLDAEVVEARSRKIAGDILDGEGQTFSLIILNWRLKNRDGFEIFWQIQADENLQTIPLVVMAEKKDIIYTKIPRYFERYFEFLSLPLVREKLWRAIASAKEKAGRSHLFIESSQPGYRLHAIAKPAMIFEDDYRVYAHEGWIFREGYLGDISLLCHNLDSDGRLHAEGEAAIEFSDGYRLYFNHGVRLPETYGQLHPHQWKAEWLLEEENAELRRILIREIGYGRICQELESVELDSWAEYALLRIGNPREDEPIYLLKMTCPSTGSIHALRVHPALTSAREAIRWVNWGIDPEDFAIQT